jgi:hypothetical protein
MGNTLLEDILNEFEKLSQDTDISTSNKIARDSLDLINVLINESELNNSMIDLCSKLVLNVKPSKEKNITLYLKNTYDYLSKNENYKKLYETLMNL